MYSFDFKKRVRYAETDKMGYLYYGHYAKYYEIGRVETLRSLGISYKKMEDDLKVMTPVMDLHIRYLAPAYYDQEITIRTILETLPNKILVFENELYNPEMELINKATVKLFFVDMIANKRVSAPDYIIERLAKYFN
jgi:acyl-CoA thioester hydrolase